MIVGVEQANPVATILLTALEQARQLGAPGDMRNRLRLAGEWAQAHGGQLPPWLDFQANPKPSPLSVLKEDQST